MTFGAFKKELVDILTPLYGKPEALAIACLVVEKLTGKPRSLQSQTTNQTIPNGQRAQLNMYRDELLQSKPVQYVLGEAWFLNRKFFVNEHVLIPRPETEELVMLTIETLLNRGLQDKSIHILDIGTGSGCIAISLALASNNWKVTGLDVSQQALEVAALNNITHARHTNWKQADFLDPKNWEAFAHYEVIVSNPPYIPLAEKALLEKNVTDWEPKLALFTPDEDPFVFYNAIAAFCKKYPLKERIVLLEGHQNYMEALQNIFSDCCSQLYIRKDIHGNERILVVHF